MSAQQTLCTSLPCIPCQYLSLLLHLLKPSCQGGLQCDICRAYVLDEAMNAPLCSLGLYV